MLTKRQVTLLLDDLGRLEVECARLAGLLGGFDGAASVMMTVDVSGLTEAIAAVDEDLGVMAPDDHLELRWPFPKRQRPGAA